GGGDLGGGDGRHPDLGADVHPRLERLQRLPEILLRLTVAVDGGRVEVVDAELHRARDRALALGGRAPDEQAADVAAAEAERGHAQPRAPERALGEAHGVRYSTPSFMIIRMALRSSR